MATRAGMSLTAQSRSSASTNFTRWRLGPTAMSRSGTSGTIHSDKGRSHGRARSPAVGARSRNSGAHMPQPMARYSHTSADALAGFRVEQVHHAVGLLAQPHGVGGLGGRSRTPPR